jgi:hypothetical protein
MYITELYVAQWYVCKCMHDIVYACVRACVHVYACMCVCADAL